MGTFDEALEDLPVGKVKEEKKKDEVVTTSVVAVLRTYPGEFADWYKRTFNVVTPFSINAFEDIIEWMRFDNNLGVRFVPISKDRVLEMLDKKAPDLGYLARHTDIGDLIQDPFDLENIMQYNIPNCLNLDLVLPISDIARMKFQTKNYFLIPNLKFLSLFVPESEKFRKYVESAGDVSGGPLLVIQETLMNYRNDLIQNVFTAESLKKFSEDSGITEIKGMINSVLEFDNGLGGGVLLDKLRSRLYERLKQYNPQLVI